MVRLSVPLSVRRRPPDLYQPTALRREVHIISLMSTLAAIVLLSVSLGLRGWATGNGDNCDYTYGLLSVEEKRNDNEGSTYGRKLSELIFKTLLLTSYSHQVLFCAATDNSVMCAQY